jgi:hypothetical protein
VTSGKRPPLWTLSVLAGTLAVVAFGVHLRGEFFWDDLDLVVKNPLLGDPHGWRRILTADLWGGATGKATDLYRPLPMLTLWAQARIWGTSPVAFRVFDLGIHLACGALFCAWLLREGAPPMVAHSTTAVFLVHPSTTEAVMWVTGGRNDLLGTSFALLSLLSVQGRRPSIGGLAAATGFVFLAMLCKEVFVVLPVVLFAYLVVRRRLGGASGRLLPNALLPVTGVAAAFALRRALGVSAATNALGAAPLDHARAFATIVWHYAVQLVTLDNGATAERFVPLTTWAAALVLAAVLATSAALVRARSLAIIGWIWFLLALAPHTVSMPITGQWGNRYAYFSGIGFGACVAFLLPELARRVRPSVVAFAPGVVAVAVLLLALRTSQEASLWRDGVTLFGADVARLPDDSRAHYHLGVELVPRGGCAAALPHFAMSAHFEPTYARALHDVSGCLIELGRPADALEPARRDVELEPQSAGAHYNYAVALLASGDRPGAVRLLQRAVALDPGHRSALSLLDELGH